MRIYRIGDEDKFFQAKRVASGSLYGGAAGVVAAMLSKRYGNSVNPAQMALIGAVAGALAKSIIRPEKPDKRPVVTIEKDNLVSAVAKKLSGRV